MSESQNKPRRRGFMLGAAVAGAATAAAVALPKVQGDAVATTSEKAPPPPENGGGYRVTDHVTRYYKSTLI
jgi:hypothetical protein